MSSEEGNRNRRRYKREDVLDIHPLSPIQMGLLFEHLHKQPDPYVRQMIFDLNGPVNSVRIEKAVDRLIAQHSILRTVFLHENLKDPVQVVLRSVPAVVSILDWGHLEASRFEEDFTGLCSDERTRGFEFDSGSMIRLILVRQKPAVYKLVWTYHHIIIDGWSLGIIIRDFLSHYTGTSAGPAEGETPFFGNYLKWIKQQDTVLALDHWRKQLEGFTQASDIPETAKNEGQTITGWQSARFSLDAATVGELRQLAARWKVTLNAIVQALWGTIVQRYTGLDDVVFGMVVSGRPAELTGIEKMAGVFINTLPLRVTTQPDTSVQDLVQGIYRQTILANQFSYVSLPDIQQQSHLKGGLFSHFVEFQNYPKDPLKALGSKAHPGFEIQLAEYREAVNYDFYLSVYPSEGLEFHLNYNTEKYLPAFVKRIGGHYHHLVKQLLQDPGSTIAELSLLTGPEKQQVFTEFNQTRVEADDNRTLLDHFVDRVRRNPSAPFIKFRDTEYSYDEVHRASDKVAGYLLSQGVEEEACIALLMERSPWMVTCILGIWKARAAYIPMEIDFPRERVQTIVENADAFALLTDSKALAEDLGSFCGGRTWYCRGEADLPESGINIDTYPGPENLAYVIYTSGSTGTPKGAMIEHWGMLNHIRAKIDDLEIDDNSIIAQNASHCFDISVWQFFTPVVAGKKSVIYPEELVLDVDALLALTIKEQVTILEVVPSFLQVFIEYLQQYTDTLKYLDTLKYVVVTGEELKKNTIVRWLELMPHIPLVNAYGATEVSDDATHCVIRTTPAAEPVPLGKPLRNFAIHIVDRYGHPVPLGVKGEIVFAGRGVGRGYLNEPEKTRHAFGVSPFPPYKGERSYRSGDIGAWLENGMPQFFGRLDHQVQIHGHRVEVGEIENSLLRHEAVKECVVVARKGSDGNDFLRAYYTSDGPVNKDILVDFLRYYLPQYMLPVQWMQLDKLPLNANGKTDRKNLPEPKDTDTGHAVRPLTAFESRLSSIWRSLLSLGPLKPDDNFFKLGGHSIMSIRLMAEIQKEFGFKTSLRDLYRHATLAAMARYIERGISDAVFIIKPAPAASHYPLTITQQNLWLAYRKNGLSGAFNEYAALRLDGELNHEHIAKATGCLFQKHEALRSIFVTEGGDVRMKVLEEVSPDFEIIDLRDYNNPVEEVNLRTHELTQSGFELEKEVPCRIRLFRLGEKEHHVIVVLHHIISDAWSLETILRDLLDFYRYPDREVKTPEIQFKDFSHWQAGYLRTRQAEADKVFWRTHIGERSAGGSIFGKPAGTRASQYEGAVAPVSLDTFTLEKLAGLSQEVDASLFVIALSALSAYWFRVTGKQALIFGTPLAGRDMGGLQEQVGLFINIVPLRVELSGTMSFTELVDQVKAKLRDIHSHQNYPLDFILEDLRSEWGDIPEPFFDLGVTWESVGLIHQGLLEDSGLKVKAVDTEVRWVKFPFWLFGEENDGSLELKFNYATAFFDEGKIAETVSQFVALLDAVANDGTLTLNKITLGRERGEVREANSISVDFDF